MRHIDIVLVSVNLPILCGIYENDVLIEQIRSDDLLLSSLPRIFEPFIPTADNIASKHKIVDSVYYANGPGSFSALKLTHIFLHTLSAIYNIKLFATSSFYFANSDYIKAFGSSYFYRDVNTGEITLIQNMAQNTRTKCEFSLPHVLDKKEFSDSTQPLYILPPVKNI